MSVIVKHRAFNPTALYGYSQLATICESMERDGWILQEIVTHHQYEAVAIFAKSASEEEIAQERGYL